MHRFYHLRISFITKITCLNIANALKTFSDLVLQSKKILILTAEIILPPYQLENECK